MSEKSFFDYTVRSVAEDGLVFSKELFDPMVEYGGYFATLPKSEIVNLKPWQKVLSIGGVGLLLAGVFSGLSGVDTVHAMDRDAGPHIDIQNGTFLDVSREFGVGHVGKIVVDNPESAFNITLREQVSQQLDILGYDPAQANIVTLQLMSDANAKSRKEGRAPNFLEGSARISLISASDGSDSDLLPDFFVVGARTGDGKLSGASNANGSSLVMSSLVQVDGGFAIPGSAESGGPVKILEVEGAAASHSKASLVIPDGDAATQDRVVKAIEYAVPGISVVDSGLDGNIFAAATPVSPETMPRIVLTPDQLTNMSSDEIVNSAPESVDGATRDVQSTIFNNLVTYFKGGEFAGVYDLEKGVFIDSAHSKVVVFPTEDSGTYEMLAFGTVDMTEGQSKSAVEEMLRQILVVDNAWRGFNTLDRSINAVEFARLIRTIKGFPDRSSFHGTVVIDENGTELTLAGYSLNGGTVIAYATGDYLVKALFMRNERVPNNLLSDLRTEGMFEFPAGE